MDKYICHMTSIDNLNNIFNHGCLLCKTEIQNNNIEFEDISNKNVQDKRMLTPVPLAPGGTLFDYVPFYFWGLTPMLLINQSRQHEIVFFISKTSLIQASNQPFVFTDRHAILRATSFSNRLEDLDNYLDMEIIKNRYWQNTGEHPDRREKKQAEFLVFNKVDLKWCSGIGTINETVKTSVEEILKKCNLSMQVKPIRRWYY